MERLTRDQASSQIVDSGWEPGTGAQQYQQKDEHERAERKVDPKHPRPVEKPANQPSPEWSYDPSGLGGRAHNSQRQAALLRWKEVCHDGN